MFERSCEWWLLLSVKLKGSKEERGSKAVGRRSLGITALRLKTVRWGKWLLNKKFGEISKGDEESKDDG